jgi:hypothetical protein
MSVPQLGWQRGRQCAAVLAALTAACGVLGCSAVHAQPPELVELRWDVPAGCPDAADVRARIRKLAASAKPSATALRAEATITRKAGGGLHLRLVIHAGALVGERNLEGRSCDALAGAAAVNLALLLSSREPLRAEDVGAPSASQPSTAEPAPDATGTPTPTPTPTATVAAEPQPTTEGSDEADDPDERIAAQPDDADEGSTRSWRALLDLPIGALELGPLPQPSLGGALGAGVWFDRWRILAEGNLWLRQELSVTGPLAAGANVDRLAVTLRTCRTYPFGRFELAPCAHVSLRHVSAHGTGANIEPLTKASTWVAAGAGAQARYHLVAWLALLASVDAAIEGARPRIAVDGVGRVGQLGPAAVKIAVGTEWIL